MGLFLKKRVEMPDKIILGNTEFVFDSKVGFHVGEWTLLSNTNSIFPKIILSGISTLFFKNSPIQTSLIFYAVVSQSR